MTTLGTLHFLRWLCEELVHALLRPVWLGYHAAPTARRSVLFRRFCALVDAAPCWPCRIEYEVEGPLFISSAPADFED